MTEEVRQMLGRWTKWAAVLALAVAGGSATLVNALGWGHVRWLVVTAIVVGLVSAVPMKIIAVQWEARAQRKADRRLALSEGGVGGGRRQGWSRASLW